MNKKLSILLTCLAISATLSITIPLLHAQQTDKSKPATPTLGKNPLMQEVLKELEHAKTNLVTIRKTFGGHKEKALKALDEAIVEVKAGLAFTEEK
jgi:hypothetical protein